MNSKTVPFAVMLVTALIVCGGLIYIVYDREEVTIEVEVVSGIYSNYVPDDLPNVGGQIKFTFTSNKSDRVEMCYPNIVFEKDGERKVFSNGTTLNWKSGQTVPVRMVYYTGEYFDVTGWTYHFEIPDHMKVGGKYKLIEV